MAAYYRRLLRLWLERLFAGVNLVFDAASIIGFFLLWYAKPRYEQAVKLLGYVPQWAPLALLALYAGYLLLRINYEQVATLEGARAQSEREGDELRRQLNTPAGALSYVEINAAYFETQIVPEAKAQDYELTRAHEARLPQLESEGWEPYPITVGGRYGIAVFTYGGAVDAVVCRRPKPYRGLSLNARRILRAAKETDESSGAKHPYTVWYKESPPRLSAGGRAVGLDGPEAIQVLDELNGRGLIEPYSALPARAGGSQVSRLTGEGHEVGAAIIKDPDSIPPP